MELDEYDDELPPISVNSSKIDESVFAMPSAEVLASQRARAEECERALQLLAEQRERREAEFRAASSTETVAPSRSSSSGSEGESALLTAVEALRVVSSAPPLPRAPRTLPALAPRLPRAARALCDLYCDRDPPEHVTDGIITSIWSWLSGLGSNNLGLDFDGQNQMQVDNQNLLTDDEVLGVGAWLAWAVTRGVPDARATRAFHALLSVASDDQVSSLAHVLCPLPPLALWRGLPPAAPRLAPALARAALHAVLTPGGTQPVSLSPLTIPEICSLISLHWRHTPPSSRSLALQVIGSALASAERASERDERASEREMLERALAVLAQTAGDKTSPDQLKIAVAASKLKILLSDRI